MASFRALLVLGDYTSPGNLSQPHYPLDICTQHVQQDTGHRGRVSSQPYAGELHLTMLPPADTQLIAWAADPHKYLTCCVVFLGIDGLSPSLVLRLDQAICVSYSEHFQPDAAGGIAYFCQLSITAERFTKQGTEFHNSWLA